MDIGFDDVFEVARAAEIVTEYTRRFMREQNIGTALHYQAVHLYTYYRKTLGWKPGDFPEAEYVSERIVSLPLFPAMTDDDLADAADATKRVLAAHRAR